ncbi:MAG TPA: SRPBCC family protein [Mycobacteriales bacterium]|nr:SRPBCC family protein [Mycobacteriales bacterium]
MPTATTGSASIDINASAQTVYDVVADVSRMGERSPECYHVHWLDGATSASVGARFRGHNRIGVIKWATTCTVTTADPGREFAFSVIDGRGREQTRWRYAIEATTVGCRLTESYEFVWCPLIARAAELPFPRDRQLRRGIRRTVEAVKQIAESSNATQALR